ncbi:MAG: recombinase family protein, partial [Pseudomonadota bacterium]
KTTTTITRRTFEPAARKTIQMNEMNTHDHQGRAAVIYCRVSSAKQTTRGDGLGSQETRCREFARYRGYQVVQVLNDDMSGSLTKRPGMDAMLRFLRRHKRLQHIVIINDISRLARGLKAHMQLRADLAEAGGILESPSIEFGEDSDSILVENLLASVSQHQRQKKRADRQPHAFPLHERLLRVSSACRLSL